jgi:hypothetical protein
VGPKILCIAVPDYKLHSPTPQGPLPQETHAHRRLSHAKPSRRRHIPHFLPVPQDLAAPCPRLSLPQTHAATQEQDCKIRRRLAFFPDADGRHLPGRRRAPSRTSTSAIFSDAVDFHLVGRRRPPLSRQRPPSPGTAQPARSKYFWVQFCSRIRSSQP